MSPTLQIGHQHHILAYSYVGDRLECHQHAEKCHQHTFFVINILKWSPSLSHQHNDVTNITVTNLSLQWFAKKTESEQ